MSVKIWFLGIFLSFSSFTYAGVVSLGAGPDFRYDHGILGDSKIIQLNTFSLGYDSANLENFSYELEYGQYATVSESGMLRVESDIRNYLFWLRQNMQAYKENLFLYFGAGAGVYQLETQTSIGGVIDNQKSPHRAMGGVSVGVKCVYLVGFLIEARLLVGDQIDPQPTYDGRAALIFNF